jgi:hypothetical protein
MTRGTAARDLLAAAKGLVHSSGPALSAVRVRASALLARQVLEDAVGRYWLNRTPAMRDCPTSAQLRCVEVYSRDGSAAKCALHLWATLSRACHHHPYDLAPSAAEVLAVLHTLETVCETLSAESPC